MRTCVVINPRAGSSDQGAALRSRMESLGNVKIIETTAPGDARAAAVRAVSDGFDTLIAAGGDGTVNEVVNGMMQDRPAGKVRTLLAVLPLGTGNDLARTLNIPLDPANAIETIASRQVRSLDLIKAKWTDQERYATNAAAGGFTGQVGEAMTDEIKSRWGPLAYLRGAVGVIPDLTHYKTAVRYDGKARQPVQALNIIVANGRTAGGGIVVAPDADPFDGALDVVIVRSATALELAGIVARVIGGDYTNSNAVTHQRARRVEVESAPGMWFNVDGELITNEPISFLVVPGAIDCIVGAAADEPVRSNTR